MPFANASVVLYSSYAMDCEDLRRIVNGKKFDRADARVIEYRIKVLEVLARK